MDKASYCFCQLDSLTDVVGAAAAAVVLLAVADDADVVVDAAVIFVVVALTVDAVVVFILVTGTQLKDTAVHEHRCPCQSQWPTWDGVLRAAVDVLYRNPKQTESASHHNTVDKKIMVAKRRWRKQLRGSSPGQ